MTAAAATNRIAVPAAQSARWSFWLYLVIFAGAVAFFIAFDIADGTPFNGDTDDLLRAVEVRSFLNSGNWYDMSFPSVRMPEIYVTPWSRLVDVPYAAIAFVLQSYIGQPRALALAFNVWPPAMAIFYVFLVVGILRRIAPGKEQLPPLLLPAISLLSVYAIWEFSPRRIDHHSVQILLLLSMIYGICRWDRAGAVVCGASIVTGVVIGLETLPLLAMTLIALPFAWLLGFEGSRRMLQWSGLSIALTALAMALLVIKPSNYWIAHSDTFSAPFVEALVGFGVLAMLLPAVFTGREFSPVRLLVSALLGLAVLACILWQYPSLLDGPFPMLNGLAKTYWFDRIYQERSALLFFGIGNYQAGTMFVAIAVLVIASAPAAIQALRADRPVLPVLWVIMLSAVLMTAASNRFLRLALAIVPLMLPLALGVMRQAAASPRGVRMMGGAAAVLVLVVAGLAVLVPKPPAYDAFDYLVRNDCRDADFSAIGKLEPGRISTPPGLGLRILYNRSEGVSVSSLSFHRSSAAIGENLKLYMAATAEERAALLRDFDYLAVCRAPTNLDNENNLPLFSELMAGRAVAGLVPITSDADLMLFRVDHAALR